MLQFWALYRQMGVKCGQGDFWGGIQDAKAKLPLFPPLSVNCPIPYPIEVIPLFYSARAKQKLDDSHGALLDYQCCVAAMTLIMFQKDKYLAEHVQFNSCSVRATAYFPNWFV